MEVGTAYEDGVFTVGFADEDDVGALLFSRSDTIDEQDSLLGVDAYSISTESGATVYGGIEAARLTDTQLELRLTVQAAGVLGVSNELVLRFKDAAGAETARVGLRRVGIAASSA